MANDRLTWQNVDAPDFSSAAQSAAIAARLFGDGLGSVSSALGGIMDRKKADNSAIALANAQRITDVNAWDKAIAERGIEGTLGFAANQLTPEALTAINNRRTDLLANQSTILDNEQTRVDTANSIDANTRDNITNQNEDQKSDFELGRSQYDFGRTKTADAVTDKTTAIRNEAASYIDTMASDSIDPVDARQRIVNDKSLSPEERATYLDTFDKQAATFYTPDKNATDKVSRLPMVNQTAQSLDIYQNDRLFADGADPALQEWTNAKNKYSGSDNPLKDLLNNYSEYNGTLKNEDGTPTPAFTTSPGKVTRIFNEAKKAFPNVPDDVIAGVLENSIRSGYLLLGDGQELKTDESVAWSTLAQFNDPAQKQTLDNRYQANKASDSAIGQIKNDLSKAANELALAYSKNQPQEVIDKKLQELKAIEERAAAITGARKLSDGTTPQSVKDALQMGASVSAPAGVQSGGSAALDVQDFPGGLDATYTQLLSRFGQP